MSKIEIISASAGSGKTFRLTELLEDGIADGSVRPHAVLATTFTTKSAAELQERVRVRLLASGHATEAQQLTAARIGTVNSVCSRLVTDFAFDLGLSPELQVLDEEPAKVAMNRCIAAVLTPDEESELADLSERLVEFDGHDEVGRVLGLARANGIPAAALPAAAVRSWEGFKDLLGKPEPDELPLDRALSEALKRFLNGAAKNGDTTKATAEAVERCQRAYQQLERKQFPAWKDWVGLAKLSTGARSRTIAEPVRITAAAQDRHPRLHRDVRRAIELTFDLARRSLDAYQTHKRERGVIDFVDQETFALKLLGRPEVKEQLATELDLVLIDEFQDTSPIQLAIFLRLAEAARRSVWVGDQKQAIYGFRGTDPALMDAAIEEILGGAEPAILKNSYRSRPGLVTFTSKLFAGAFAHQQIPPSRVNLVAADPADPQELGPVVECWRLEAKNRTEDAAALAAAAKAFLTDSTVQVRDRKDGSIRPPRASDVAILCRTNAQCLEVAEQLADLGVRPVLPRQGLLSTLEGRTAMAALRLWVEGRDTLAMAELARLIDFAGKEDEWFASVLRNPGEAAFVELPLVARIRQERDNHHNLGVVAAFDLVVECLDLPGLCRRWGDAQARIANIEAFRAHVVRYVEGCAAVGSGCSAAGLIAYMLDLAESEEDGQGVDEDDHAIVVTTWHKAKGLEWPIVVLFPLTRRDPSLRALGVGVQTDQPKLTLADPLAGRWIRYWPNPYLSQNNNTPFHGRLDDHPATAIARIQADREDLRLLYVGWTRARDRVVLAGRDGKLTTDLLQLLCNSKGHPVVTEPAGRTIDWAGEKVKIVNRLASPLPPQPRQLQPEPWYVAAGPRAYPPAFLRPSAAVGDDSLVLSQHERIGRRIGITGDCDWAHLGNAMHGFLCADRPGLDQPTRMQIAEDLLSRWGLRSAVITGDVVATADALIGWVQKKWPQAEWCREWPVLYRDATGSIVRGSSDLVLTVPGGYVVIDHKSFPGNVQQALTRASEYAGQIRNYVAAIEAATGAKVLSTWVHLPVSGIVVPLSV